MDYSKRIRNLEKKYSETNINSREVLFPSTVKKINKTYNDNQQKRRVDTILNNINNKDSIKEEVHDIVKSNNLKELCRNCREEQIIAVIILYVQRTRNSKYLIDRTSLWREYDLSWLKYSLIIERLLKATREQTRVKSDVVVDNDGVRW